ERGAAEIARAQRALQVRGPVLGLDLEVEFAIADPIDGVHRRALLVIRALAREGSADLSIGAVADDDDGLAAFVGIAIEARGLEVEAAAVAAAEEEEGHVRGGVREDRLQAMRLAVQRDALLSLQRLRDARGREHPAGRDDHALRIDGPDRYRRLVFRRELEI